MRRFLSGFAAASVATFAFAGVAHGAGIISPNNQLRWPSGSAKAWIIVIHGGGWKGGADLMEPDLAVARWFNEQGYGTYTIDYRSGEDSYYDTVAAFQWLAQSLRSSYTKERKPVPPICAWGESAGGHLALMLAGTFPTQVACVISQAGPTDLMTFPSETADGASVLASYDELVVPIFGSDLSQWSPISFCPNMPRSLLGASSADRLVPQAQMTNFAAACRNAKTVLLDGNPAHGPLVAWTHADVTKAAADAWTADELAFLPQ